MPAVPYKRVAGLRIAREKVLEARPRLLLAFSRLMPYVSNINIGFRGLFSSAEGTSDEL